MPVQEMTRFRLQLVENTNSTEFHILLVEEAAGEAPSIAAETTVAARQASLPRITASTIDHQTYFDAAKAAGKKVFSLDGALEGSKLGVWAAFRTPDAARGMISDAVYSWLLSNVVQKYDKGTIDMDDTHFIILGDGMALSSPKGRAARAGKTSGPVRPKRTKKLTHSWF